MFDRILGVVEGVLNFFDTDAGVVVAAILLLLLGVIIVGASAPVR